MNPIVRSIRARFGLRPMPLNIIHDADGLPRLVLTEPTGSSIEVGSLRLLSFVIFVWTFSRIEETLTNYELDKLIK